MSHDFTVTQKQVGLIRFKARKGHVDDLRLIELLFEAASSQKPRPQLRSNHDANSWLCENLPKFKHKHVNRLLSLIEEEPDGRSETAKARAAHAFHMKNRRYYD